MSSTRNRFPTFSSSFSSFPSSTSQRDSRSLEQTKSRSQSTQFESTPKIRSNKTKFTREAKHKRSGKWRSEQEEQQQLEEEREDEDGDDDDDEEEEEAKSSELKGDDSASTSSPKRAKKKNKSQDGPDDKKDEDEITSPLRASAVKLEFGVSPSRSGSSRSSSSSSNGSSSSSSSRNSTSSSSSSRSILNDESKMCDAPENDGNEFEFDRDFLLTRIRVVSPDAGSLESDLPNPTANFHIDFSSASSVTSSSSCSASSSFSSSSSTRRSIVYWMSRDQRLKDNWALIFASRLAAEHDATLRIVFCLVPTFLEASERQYDFMLRGLKQVESDCRSDSHHIPFHLLTGFAFDTLPEFAREYNVGAIVTDFSPLKVIRSWTTKVALAVGGDSKLSGSNIKTKSPSPSGIPLFVVDAHNVVPVWITSSKQEWAARTLRPKIHRFLNTYLVPYPRVLKQDSSVVDLPPPVEWEAANQTLKCDRSVPPVDWIEPGEKAAAAMLQSFASSRLKFFADKRNDPNTSADSNLSPYFHFGQLSPARSILTVRDYQSRYPASVAAFIEETVVRRELSDNYCYYNPNYDSLTGSPDWAQKTLNSHRGDGRDFLYNLSEFEFGVTHDPLWNAMQLQMVRTGKMFGWCRMYWAKKMLEWTESPEQAIKWCQYLNDRYELDGRDPNGFVGVMWAIAGLHDTAWAERQIFGKVRFMNFAGAKRKFNIQSYIQKFDGAVPESTMFRKNQTRGIEMEKRRQKSLREGRGEFTVGMSAAQPASDISSCSSSSSSSSAPPAWSSSSSASFPTSSSVASGSRGPRVAASLVSRAKQPVRTSNEKRENAEDSADDTGTN